MSIEYKPEYIQKLKLLRDKSINLIYEQRNDMKYYPVEGITLHQYYAGLAMQGILSSKDSLYSTPESIAECSCKYADALIAELERGWKWQNKRRLKDENY